MRLWVNDQPVIDTWTNHSSTEDSGTIALTAGMPYSIRLEYYDNTGGALVRLSWSSASQGKPPSRAGPSPRRPVSLARRDPPGQNRRRSGAALPMFAPMPTGVSARVLVDPENVGRCCCRVRHEQEVPVGSMAKSQGVEIPSITWVRVGRPSAPMRKTPMLMSARIEA